MGITFTRPQHIIDLLHELEDVLYSDQHTELSDYIEHLERENSALRLSKSRAWQIRDTEEKAFQQRLAELKATQVVAIPHGGRIS